MILSHEFLPADLSVNYITLKPFLKKACLNYRIYFSDNIYLTNYKAIKVLYNILKVLDGVDIINYNNDLREDLSKNAVYCTYFSKENRKKISIILINKKDINIISKIDNVMEDVDFYHIFDSRKYIIKNIIKNMKA